MRKRVNLIKILLLVIVLALAGFFIYFNFYYKTCVNEECFYSSLEKCKRASFLSVGDMTFKYTIEGKSQGFCEVNVKLIRGDLSNQDSLKLQGKEMKCDLQLGDVSSPEDNIENCHGLLKEGLQDLIINKLYTYIAQNLNQINSSLRS